MTTTDLRERLALAPEQLRRHVDPDMLPFDTTADVPPLEGTVGQPRATEAIEFGLEIDTGGYNIYVSGVPGSRRESTILDYLREFAVRQETPPDWIYVHNFAEPDHPRAIRLPTGSASRFAAQMDQFLRAVQREIPRAFESEDYERQRRESLNGLNQKRSTVLNQVRAFAQERGFMLEMTPSGIVNVPVMQGKPLAPAEFEALPEEIRQGFATRGEEVQERVVSALREIRVLEKEAMERLRQLDMVIVLFAVGPLIDDLRDDFSDNPEILEYIDQVREDIPRHLHLFWSAAPTDAQPMFAPPTDQAREEQLARYSVNVLIDNSRTDGAPVVLERNPTFYNLNGRVDFRPMMGSMVTDFRQIKPGALHHANGGFLVLHAPDVLSAPLSWDALKRALTSGEIQIENPGEQMTPIPTSRLRPEPIPLDIKVILIGPPMVYQALFNLDDDFQELFKVKADFAPDMDWSEDIIEHYAAFISRQVRECRLKHLDRGAVARVIEHGSELMEDQRKLTTRLLDIANVVTEASFWAGKAGREIVTAEDIDKAIEKREYRSNLIEERVHERINDGTIMIATSGSRIGQVNGMAVLASGDHIFGRPSRITARVALGNGVIQSIERETKLSGPMHTKGVLILAGYLAATYAQELPLAVSASITFEQSYNEVDGDSASSAELYALLSALSGLPIDQGIAVTGSVNQFGEIQAVGGVTHKIEGYFATCRTQGFTGKQGVLIPATNIANLVLNKEVVEAVRNGQFQIWATSTIDEGIEILTGVPAGVRGPDGAFPEGTVHWHVEQQLRQYAERLHEYSRNDSGTAIPPAAVLRDSTINTPGG